MIKKRKILGLKSLNDKVTSFNCVCFSVSLSRKLLIICLFISYCFFSLIVNGFEETCIISDMKWAEYLNDCSAENIIKDKSNVQKVFYKTYYGNIVSWEGYLMKASMNDGWMPSEYVAHILVKMDPTESEYYPDIVITLDSSAYNKYKDAIVSLSRGDLFSFNATLFNVGDEESIHHLKLIQMQKKNGKIDIPYEMRNKFRSSAFANGVEIVGIVDIPFETDHDHVHYYNDTFNQTIDE